MYTNQKSNAVKYFYDGDTPDVGSYINMKSRISKYTEAVFKSQKKIPDSIKKNFHQIRRTLILNQREATLSFIKKEDTGIDNDCYPFYFIRKLV